MKHPSNPPRVVSLALLLALAIMALPIATVAGATCDADIESEFRKKTEGSTKSAYVWKVDVTTPETCAVVKFTLWVLETDSAGEESEQTRQFEIKAKSSETKSRKVKHVVPRSTNVKDWRFEIRSCRPCGG
jgi:hypothetical protein